MHKDKVTGVILAGGKATRMGGLDKGLVQINGYPMIVLVMNALQPQVSKIFVNANRNKKTYGKFGHQVIADDLDGFQGPLAGMATAMKHASTEFVFTCPCDGPMLPGNIVERLYSELSRQHAEICVAHDGDRMQSVYALINCRLQESLRTYLADGGRKIENWYEKHAFVQADFSKAKNCFLNVNRQSDLAEVSAHLKI